MLPEPNIAIFFPITMSRHLPADPFLMSSCILMASNEVAFFSPVGVRRGGPR